MPGSFAELRKRTLLARPGGISSWISAFDLHDRVIKIAYLFGKEMQIQRSLEGYKRMIQQPSLSTLQEACRLWQQGEVVAIPTETVYGLAADAAQDLAVAKIFTIKGRPQFNPLILHISSLEQLEAYAEIPPLLFPLASAFWPGPLTVVLKRKPTANLSHLATAGLDTLAVRWPDHPLAQELLRMYGKPLVAPSANKSNSLSPTSAQAVADSLSNQVSLIIDGGKPTIGLESTIIDLTTSIPTILRPGGITFEALSAKIGLIQIIKQSGEIIKAPGMLKRHYAPGLPLRLQAHHAQPGEALLGFGPVEGNLNLSPTGDLAEAAANLFWMLRQLDTPLYQAIAVAPIPHHHLGIAINDRLQRAATLKEEEEE